jgi:hypothetical protein
MQLRISAFAFCATLVTAGTSFAQSPRTPAAGGSEDAKRLAEVLRAEPEYQSIQREIGEALLAQGSGQFENRMKDLTARRDALVMSNALRLGIDRSRLPKARPSGLKKPSAGKALASSVSPGLKPAAVPELPDISWQVLTTEISSLPKAKSSKNGECGNLSEDNQAGPPATMTSASASVPNGACVINHTRELTIKVPPTYNGKGNPSEVRITARIIKSMSRVDYGDTNQVIYMHNQSADNLCWGTYLSRTSPSEESSENFTVECTLKLPKGGDVPLYFSVDALSWEGGTSMAQLVVDSITTAIIYKGN